MYNKAKVEVCLVNTMAHIGCRGNPVTRRRWEGQLRTPVALPQGKAPGTNRTGD